MSAPSSKPGGSGDSSSAATSLARSILARSSQAGTERASEPASAPPATAEDVERLIAVYFELEEPIERDAAFAELCAARHATADAFLAAMMEHDDDEVMRVAAAAELARRGNPAGEDRLSRELTEPTDYPCFSYALHALAELRGAAAYDAFAHIWNDPARDPDERREAMVGMELVNTARALHAACDLIEETVDMATFDDERLEQAMLTLARHDVTAAAPLLEDLIGRIQASQLSPDEKEDLTDLVHSGLNVLRAS